MLLTPVGSARLQVPVPTMDTVSGPENLELCITTYSLSSSHAKGSAGTEKQGSRICFIYFLFFFRIAVPYGNRENYVLNVTDSLEGFLVLRGVMIMLMD